MEETTSLRTKPLLILLVVYTIALILFLSKLTSYTTVMSVLQPKYPLARNETDTFMTVLVDRRKVTRDEFTTESQPGLYEKADEDSSLPLGSGYIIALEIYEQQTMGTGNIFQLQCFASKLNLSVVQPLMKNSFFYTPLNSTEHVGMIELEDLYNMQEWTNYTQSRGYAPLVRWEDFMEHAPRDVILVQMNYLALSRIKDIQKSGEKFPHPVSESKDYMQGCDFNKTDKALEALTGKNFRVVKKVCYNFTTGDIIPLQAFQEDLSSDHNNSRATIIIDAWRGFGGPQRVLLEDQFCQGSDYYREYVDSSLRVEIDAQHYIDRYLQGSSNTEYLAVIGRYEMTVLSKKMHGEADPYAIIPHCLQKTLEEVLEMKKEKRARLGTFLSIDAGKYGSVGFIKHNYFNHRKDFEEFVSSVYGGQMNITEWDRTFESVVETTDTGYMAKVQQAIVARAKCILFVGGGTFQRHTLHLYQQLHPDPSDRCVRILKECTSSGRPVE